VGPGTPLSGTAVWSKFKCCSREERYEVKLDYQGQQPHQPRYLDVIKLHRMSRASVPNRWGCSRTGRSYGMASRRDSRSKRAFFRSEETVAFRRHGVTSGFACSLTLHLLMLSVPTLSLKRKSHCPYRRRNWKKATSWLSVGSESWSCLLLPDIVFLR
jgi:hypothetical protein